MAEAFELADRAAAGAFGLMVFGLLWPGVLVGLVGGEQLPAAGEDVLAAATAAPKREPWPNDDGDHHWP